VGEPGKLDKVADIRKETKLDRHLEIPVCSIPIPDQGSILCLANSCQPSEIGAGGSC